MHAHPGLSALLALALPAMVLHAQDWDAARSAKGWARLDATGAATFYDATSRQLISWMKDGGVIGKVDLSKADLIPERWVVDDEHIWIMGGNTMKQISKAGQVTRTQNLPAEVADVDFLPPNGIAISYRTLTPFIERRDIKNGGVVWTYGAKPRKGDSPVRVLHRILRNDEMNLVVMSGEDISATLVDGKKGNALGQAVFTLADAMPPKIALGDKDRGASAWWWGKSVAFAAVTSSSLPSLKQQGLLLARLDFAASAVEFLPTGLTEDFQLAGITEDRAAFTAPNGGLVFVAVK